MIICDLCDEAKDCLQKEIEGKEYDICSECWNPFAQRSRSITRNSDVARLGKDCRRCIRSCSLAA